MCIIEIGMLKLRKNIENLVKSLLIIFFSYFFINSLNFEEKYHSPVSVNITVKVLSWIFLKNLPIVFLPSLSV